MTERSDIHKYSIINIQFRLVRVRVLFYYSLRMERNSIALKQKL